MRPRTLIFTCTGCSSITFVLAFFYGGQRLFRGVISRALVLAFTSGSYSVFKVIFVWLFWIGFVLGVGNLRRAFDFVYKNDFFRGTVGFFVKHGCFSDAVIFVVVPVEGCGAAFGFYVNGRCAHVEFVIRGLGIQIARRLLVPYF